MPPKDNTNKNIPEPTPFKVGLNPVFQNNNNRPLNPPIAKDTNGIADILTNQAYQPNKTTDYTEPKATLHDNTNIKKSIIRTYKDDLVQAINRDHLSSINIAIAENQRQQKNEKTDKSKTESEYSKSKILILISLILILLGSGAIAFVFLNNQGGNTRIIAITELPSLITTEYKDEFNISNIEQTKILTALSTGLNTIEIPIGKFYNVYLTTGTSTNRRLLSSQEMISLLGFKMPDIIKRSLFPDFMIGMYNTKLNSPFIIFKVSYFENAYAGMFDWEKDLEKDFETLFRLPGYEQLGSLISEITASNDKKFQDAVILNKDIRLIKDENNQIILLYSIIDKETIVITTSDTAFKEIIDRLNKEKTLRR